MWPFLQVVVICGTFIYLWHRAEPFIVRRQVVSLPETVSEPVSASVPLKLVEPIPPDLMNVALRESEEWARTGVLTSMLDAYQRCGDWNVVRAMYVNDADPVN